MVRPRIYKVDGKESIPGQFVRAREALCAAGKGAGMWLFARVSPDVTSLVFQTVESLIAQRALVGAGEVLARLVLGLLRGVLQQRSHEAHGSSGHGSVGGGRRGVVSSSSGRVRVEEVGKT